MFMGHLIWIKIIINHGLFVKITIIEFSALIQKMINGYVNILLNCKLKLNEF